MFAVREGVVVVVVVTQNMRNHLCRHVNFIYVQNQLDPQIGLTSGCS